jgi:hypothetical protein
VTDRIIARLASDGEAKLVRSLLETYGIPSTLSYDMPGLVYPLTVGEIRVAVPEGLGEEALSILAAHQGPVARPAGEIAVSALDALPFIVPFSEPLLAQRPADDEEEEEEEDDDDEWEDGGDDDDDDEIDDEDGGDDDDDDDDLFDDEE